jgi:hypothetical protein
MLINRSVTWWHDGETTERTVPLQVTGAGGSPGGSGTAIDQGYLIWETTYCTGMTARAAVWLRR